MNFSVTALHVLLLMAYAVPGFLFVKTKTLTLTQIAPFSKTLVYFCQPCLEVYAFQSATCTPALLREMGLFFLFCTGAQLLMVLLMAVSLRFRMQEVRRSVSAAAGVFGNIGFIGIPLLQALLPEAVVPEALALAAVFALSMNLLAWTCGLFLMTGEKRHIHAKAILLNPATIAFYLAFPLFLLGIQLPTAVSDTIALAGRMSTPLCMIALGMRLAGTSFRQILTDRYAWRACVGKLLVMPLLALAAVWFLPVPAYFKASLFLLCCCPTASVVQTFSEIFLPDSSAGGRRTAADTILLSTLLCMLTIPLLALLIQV